MVVASTLLMLLWRAAERNSDHPLSRAIVDAAVDSGYTLSETMDFESLTARGVAATVNGKRVLAGHVRLFEEQRIALDDDARDEMKRLEAAGRTVIIAAVDGAIVGVIGIADEVKKTAPRAVAALRALGLRVIMMTGDRDMDAVVAAGELNINGYVIKPVSTENLITALESALGRPTTVKDVDDYHAVQLPDLSS